MGNSFNAANAAFLKDAPNGFGLCFSNFTRIHNGFDVWISFLILFRVLNYS